MNDKKLLKEQAVEILEILKKEGIDVTKITTTKKDNGVKRTRYLCEIPDDRIDYIIKKHNFDPEFKIGRHVKDMRTHPETYDYSYRKRIKSLGFSSAENKIKGKFKNQIEEGFYVLYKLKEEGVDIPFIPQSLNGKMICLGDIECPEIENIIKKIDFKKDYPIGLKIRTIMLEYNGTKHDYTFKEEERKKVEELGLSNTPEKNAVDTLNIINILKENNIDISDMDEEIILNDGSKRKKYLFEISDNNIKDIIKKYNLPKYFLIGQRVNRLKTIIYKDLVSEEIKNQIRDLFFKKEEKEEPIKEDVELVVPQTIRLVRKLNEFGIDMSILSVTKMQDGKQVPILLEDLPLSSKQLDEIMSEFNIKEDFKFGKRISNIRLAYKKTGALRISMTIEDKHELEKLKIVDIESVNNSEFTNREKIEMLQILQKLGINSFKPTYQEDGKTKRTMLKMIGLDKEALEYFKSRYNVDESYRIGYITERLRKAFRQNKLSHDEIISLQKLGILTELDILEHEQINLNKNLEDAKNYSNNLNNKMKKESDEKKI